MTPDRGHESRDGASPPPAVRLLILCAGDPEAERTFSGSARSLFRALERQGVVHAKGDVTHGFTNVFTEVGLPLRILRKLDRLGVEKWYRWTERACEQNSRRARMFAQGHLGYNACLMYGTNYLPRLEAPTYCCFDATVAQVAAAKGWEFARFSPGKVRRLMAYQKRVFDACACVCPRTEWAARSVEEDYGIPRTKIMATHAGPNFYAEPLPHAAYDRRTILFIGRDWERKGGPLVHAAFLRVRKELPDARLVVVGCTPPIDGPGIELAGPIKKDAKGGLERILAYYREASVFCIMSAFEPFGIVVVEAQNCFVPCVVPAKFAFTETVQDGVTGRHVRQETPKELARVFLELLRDPARLAEMGRAAHEFVRTQWTWDVAAERIVARIRQDLSRASRRA